MNDAFQDYYTLHGGTRVLVGGNAKARRRWVRKMRRKAAALHARILSSDFDQWVRDAGAPARIVQWPDGGEILP